MSREGKPVTLSAPEFELLLLLVRNRGRTVEKKEIMKAVWPDVEVEDNNLTVRMSSLRRTLGETKGHHPYIQTVSGRGYCLIVPVKELPAAAPPVAEKPGGFLAVTPRLHKIHRPRLYAILLSALGAISLIYVGLRVRTKESQALAQSMKMSRLTHSGRIAWTTISPDGQNIAYVERNGDLHSLWLQRPGTNNPLQLLSPVNFVYKDLAFSPDGNTLYYTKCQSGCKLYKMPALGGVETALDLRADCPVTFSPDGRQMAYARVDAVGSTTEVSLLTANENGANEKTVYSKPGGLTYQGGAPAWSPDGKTIALPLLVDQGEQQRYMKVIGVRVSDGSETTLTPQRWRWIKDVAWLPDGQSLIINGRDTDTAPALEMQIWRVPLTGGEPRRITNDLNNYTRIATSADGSKLIALQVQWTSGLWVAPAEDTVNAVQVTQGSIDRQDGTLGVSMSPDERLVYVSALSGKRDLWSINADGSGLRQLTDGSHNDISPVVTPDGRYIVFESTRDGAHSIWRVDADGRNPMRLTRGSHDTEPVCTPDGNWVIYVAYENEESPKLRKVSIEGGDPASLTEDFAQHPAVSPDGKVIAYYFMDKQQRDRREIVLIPAAGGRPLKTFPAPKNFGGLMRWAASGDAIAYRNRTLDGLWRLPLDGKPPTAIMELSSRLHSFSYSYDGRRLVYASGPIQSDIVIISQFQ